MRWIRSSLVLAAALAAACDDGGGDDATDGGAPGADASDRPGDRFVAGLEKAGAAGRLRTRLVDAQPAPPERGDNRWVLEVLDPDGGPWRDCAVDVDPRMPAHDHGSPVEAQVTPDDTPGRYVLEPVNLFMPGLWEITLRFDCGGVEDEVMYAFWIEG